MPRIALLAAQYFEQIDPPNLSLPDGPTLVSPAIQNAIYENMFNEDTAWPLPPTSYQTRVLKVIITRIEESISDPEEDEILDNLLEKWTTLVSTPRSTALEQAQKLTYIKYTAPSLLAAESSSERTERRTIITSENRSLILASGTTGFRTWEAALHLGTFLSTTSLGKSLVAGKRVLELGAGTGFLSFLIAKYLGAENILVTDRDPALLQQIDGCIGKNGLEKTRIRTGIWEWGLPLQVPSFSEVDDVTERDPAEFDIALGADLIYDVDIVPLLVSTIRDLFDNYSLQEFIISATMRNEDTFHTFLNACERNRLAVVQIPFDSPLRERQTGFFHSTSIPIQTYRIQTFS
ncbi:putative methyltransferase-domain-containing protein [Aspergillus granulosus]|uniref:Methyltransferase-domain-containing protein n=1 Tax=Aspergillus granulosus TaxID=176169 RepID=A0ABR4H0H1_9EURO